ncbi:MAG: acetylglutamate kinase [Chloroflexi bacterium HGW-Chloroflexi-9]|nr:MAG: acetylglutamate kinase [Chloroflexi bacterium HGW-Chloroflexi-9]
MTNSTKRATVIKIGGSTLGSEDTSLQDVAALHRAGERVVVVHGGGAMITDWLKKMAIDSVFVDGLRSTNEAALEVVVGVLRGVVNAQLVGEIVALGGRAIGVCGVDGGCVRAERYDDRLGYVGRVTSVDGPFIEGLLDAGFVPVIAPIGFEAPNQPLNINADTVAGEVARAIHADSLTFLTDVDGLLDASKTLMPEVDAARAAALRAEGTLSGGMIPKIDACFRAAEVGVRALIANGTTPGTLRRIAAGESVGTRIKG